MLLIGTDKFTKKNPTIMSIPGFPIQGVRKHS